MPYIRLDEEGFEETEDGDGRYTGPFNYCKPNEVAYKPHPFDPARLTQVAAAIHAALVARGVTRFRLTYDGGHDEGFAHADAVWFGDGDRRSAGDVADEWAGDTALSAVLDTAARHRHAEMAARYTWMANQAYSPGEDTPRQIVHAALDELAQAVAGSLLGDGFGTGEYSIYGACVDDLHTNAVIDEPSASPPRGVLFD